MNVIEMPPQIAAEKDELKTVIEAAFAAWFEKKGVCNSFAVMVAFVELGLEIGNTIDTTPVRGRHLTYCLAMVEDALTRNALLRT